MGIPIIGTVVDAVSEGYQAYVGRKTKKQQARHQENMAVVERIKNMDDNDAAYALEQVRAQKESWKDEFVTIVLFVPAILCFIDISLGSVVLDGPSIVSAGFESLDKAPEWYQALLTGAATAAIGINEYRKHSKKALKDKPE